MKDRLLQLLEKEKISSAEFADRIGVQRSNVSHILNGRNNPGFSFIQKVLETFPKVNPRWLIMGEGSIETSSLSSPKSMERNLFSVLETGITEPVSKPEVKVEVHNKNSTENTEKQTLKQPEIIVSSSKKIVRVLFFYDDNTFEDFSPKDK